MGRGVCGWTRVSLSRPFSAVYQCPARLALAESSLKYAKAALLEAEEKVKNLASHPRTAAFLPPHLAERWMAIEVGGGMDASCHLLPPPPRQTVAVPHWSLHGRPALLPIQKKAGGAGTHCHVGRGGEADRWRCAGEADEYGAVASQGAVGHALSKGAHRGDAGKGACRGGLARAVQGTPPHPPPSHTSREANDCWCASCRSMPRTVSACGRRPQRAWPPTRSACRRWRWSSGRRAWRGPVRA